MILEKELYNSINTARSLIRSCWIYSSSRVKSVFSSNDVHSLKEVKGIPKIHDVSDLGLCKIAQEVCPTDCLEFDIENEKVVKVHLDVIKCTLCSLCEYATNGKVVTLSDKRDLSAHFETNWRINIYSNED